MGLLKPTIEILKENILKATGVSKSKIKEINNLNISLDDKINIVCNLQGDCKRLILTKE